MNLKTMLSALLPLTIALPAAAQGSDFVTDGPAKRMHGAQNRVVAAAPRTNAMAWMVRDRAQLPLGLVSFNLAEPTNFTSTHPLTDKAFAGVNTPEGYFFYRFRDDAEAQEMQPLAWSKVDPATGEVTNIADWSEKAFIFNDMAYDYSTGTIYAIAREYYTDDFLTALSFEYSALYTVDAGTGVATRIHQWINWENGGMNSPTYITLTADLEGNLYAVDDYGYLVTFDRDNDWQEVTIGDTGRRPAMRLQSMDYDPVSGKIFWAADYEKALADLCMIDPVTARTQVVGLLGNDARVAGLAIPFDIPSSGAPAAVSDLKVSYDANGANTARISFTTPAKTFSNGNLASISAVTLDRNGSTANTWTSPASGQSLDYTDNVPEAGYYTYTVTAANALGNGLGRSVTLWVGHDVPDAVSLPGIGRNDDGSAVIEWYAPLTGLHGGWIDAANMAYDVVRLPDNVLVAKDLKATTFTDNTIVSMAKYSYQITPHTPDGRGPAATTVDIELGNVIATYPYNCLFEDKSVFDTWTVLNPNGGSHWNWKHRGLSDYDAFAMYEYDNNNAADDYLVSPGMLMEPGAEYTLRFNYRGSNANYTEKFEVMFGNAPTVEGMTDVLESYTVTTGEGAFDTLTLPAVESEGTYYFSFHATSDKKMYNLYITDVTVTKTGGTDTPDPEVPGEMKPVENLKATVSADNSTVTLSWTHNTGQGGSQGGDDDNDGRTDPVEEDWENYPAWEVNPESSIGWKFIDRDGGIPYRSDYADMPYPTDGTPCAAMIMAPFELSSEVYTPNPPHSGEQYLLFKSNFSAGDGSRPAPAPDDYLISPKLNFDKDFVFSFWCKADPDLVSQESGFWGDELWNTEHFRVGYSKSGNEPEDFTWLSDTPETVTTMGSSWTQKEYAIPADAKYVAINYCTPEYGFWFMVDDIYIGTPRLTGKPARETVIEPTFSHFDVYVDDNKAGATEATSYILENLENGTHTAKVVAVYEEGESTPAEIEFLVNQSGITAVNDDAITVGPNPATEYVRLSTTVSAAKLYDMSGKCVAAVENSDIITLDGVMPGIYLLRLTADGETASFRLIVK